MALTITASAIFMANTMFLCRQIYVPVCDIFITVMSLLYEKKNFFFVVLCQFQDVQFVGNCWWLFNGHQGAHSGNKESCERPMYVWLDWSDMRLLDDVRTGNKISGLNVYQSISWLLPLIDVFSGFSRGGAILSNFTRDSVEIDA